MLKLKVFASLAVLLLCLQSFSYSQQSAGNVDLGNAEIFADPIIDVHGNLLIFRMVVSKTTGVETEVTLISPSATKITQTYPGILSQIRRGEKGVYAIQRVPVASTAKTTSAATPSLVALVTGPGSLPDNLVNYPLSAKFELFKVASGFLTGGPDVIYLAERSTTGPDVLVLTFDGKTFTQVPGSPVPLS